MPDFHAIEEVISLYFKGLHEGDVSLAHTLFLPSAGICGYYEGELINMNLLSTSVYYGICRRHYALVKNLT